MKVIFIIVFLIVANIVSFGQRFDTTFIEPVKLKFSMKSFLADKVYTLTFRPKSNTSNIGKITYSPNLTKSISIGGSYNNIALNLSIRLKNSAQEIKEFGRTNFTDLGFNLYIRNVFVSVNYRDYKGFYVKSPENLTNDGKNTNGNLNRSDLNIKNYSFEVYYAFNRAKYSMNAAYKCTERQIKSAGSFLLFSEISYMQINSDSSLIPLNVAESYGNKNGFTDAIVPSVSLLLGYSYSLVYKRFYLNPSVFFGYGYNDHHYDSSSNNSLKDNLMLGSFFRIAAGYNGNRFCTALFFDSQNFRINDEQVSFRSSDFLFKLMVGYKFNL